MVSAPMNTITVHFRLSLFTTAGLDACVLSSGAMIHPLTEGPPRSEGIRVLSLDQSHGRPPRFGGVESIPRDAHTLTGGGSGHVTIRRAPYKQAPRTSGVIPGSRALIP